MKYNISLDSLNLTFSFVRELFNCFCICAIVRYYYDIYGIFNVFVNWFDIKSTQFHELCVCMYVYFFFFFLLLFVLTCMIFVVSTVSFFFLFSFLNIRIYGMYSPVVSQCLGRDVLIPLFLPLYINYSVSMNEPPRHFSLKIANDLLAFKNRVSP